MARKKEGEVKIRDWKGGRGYALRFRAYGERRYLTLGFERDGWNLDRAEEELQNVLADVRRGIWVPPPKKRPGQGVAIETAEPEAPLFGAFATGLVEAREGQVAENTTSFERWGLGHLVPYFGDWPVHEIDAKAVDDYRLQKVKQAAARASAIEHGRPQRDERGRVLRPLSPASINKTIEILRWALGIAFEYGYVAENAAAGKKRRLKEPPARPVHLDTAEHIEALLEAAAELDRAPRCHCRDREAIIATLVFAGPRAHELCNLLWRDIDLANGRIFIGRSKTAAGLREIRMSPILRDILAAHKAGAYRSGPDDLVFPSGTGGRRDKDNIRERVLAKALERADELLARRDLIPLPRGLTTHKLRHTFASVLIACGEDPTSVMQQLGHTDPSFTLRVYSHLMNRDPVERKRLKALVNGERVVALKAPLPGFLDLAAYEVAILHELAERGGRAARRDVVAAVGRALSSRHSTRDLEPLPSGPPRWEPRVAKARKRLVARSWLVGDSGRGEWELTKLGRAKARRDENKDRSPQAVRTHAAQEAQSRAAA
ncbi:MAG: site-specific integrase [Solirubrobacterales bacterium]